MYFPPLEPVSYSESYISGDVTVDPTAVVAPGAILQAAPGSKIVVEAGVCIGMGAIVKAYRGKIEIKRGSILGAAVLVVGNSTIGAQSSIGAATTIFNATVEPMAVIFPGSVIGDSSRQIQEAQEKPKFQEQSSSRLEPLEKKDDTQEPTEEVESAVLEPAEQSPLLQEIPVSESPSSPVATPEKIETPSPSFELEESPWYSEAEVNSEVNSEINKGAESKIEMEIEAKKEAQPPSSEGAVIGKVYINQLLLTLFPHKQ